MRLRRPALLVWTLRIGNPISRQVDHRFAAQALKDVEAFAVGARPSANHGNPTQRAALRRRRLIAAKRHDVLTGALMGERRKSSGLWRAGFEPDQRRAGSVDRANRPL